MDRIDKLKQILPKLKNNNKINPLKIECLEWELKYLELKDKGLICPVNLLTQYKQNYPELTGMSKETFQVIVN